MSWKTTIFGIAAGVLNLFAQGTNWKQILFSTGLATLGLVAKDHNVTGGTVVNTDVTKSSRGVGGGGL